MRDVSILLIGVMHDEVEGLFTKRMLKGGKNFKGDVIFWENETRGISWGKCDVNLGLEDEFFSNMNMLFSMFYARKYSITNYSVLGHGDEYFKDIDTKLKSTRVYDNLNSVDKILFMTASAYMNWFKESVYYKVYTNNHEISVTNFFYSTSNTIDTIRLFLDIVRECIFDLDFDDEEGNLMLNDYTMDTLNKFLSKMEQFFITHMETFRGELKEIIKYIVYIKENNSQDTQNVIQRDKIKLIALRDNSNWGYVYNFIRDSDVTLERVTMVVGASHVKTLRNIINTQINEYKTRIRFRVDIMMPSWIKYTIDNNDYVQIRKKPETKREIEEEAENMKDRFEAWRSDVSKFPMRTNTISYTTVITPTPSKKKKYEDNDDDDDTDDNSGEQNMKRTRYTCLRCNQYTVKYSEFGNEKRCFCDPFCQADFYLLMNRCLYFNNKQEV